MRVRSFVPIIPTNKYYCGRTSDLRTLFFHEISCSLVSDTHINDWSPNVSALFARSFSNRLVSEPFFSPYPGVLWEFQRR
jgi:hypothetical protein